MASEKWGGQEFFFGHVPKEMKEWEVLRDFLRRNGLPEWTYPSALLARVDEVYVMCQKDAQEEWVIHLSLYGGAYVIVHPMTTGSELGAAIRRLRNPK